MNEHDCPYCECDEDWSPGRIDPAVFEGDSLLAMTMRAYRDQIEDAIFDPPLLPYARKLKDELGLGQ